MGRPLATDALCAAFRSCSQRIDSAGCEVFCVWAGWEGLREKIDLAQAVVPQVAVVSRTTSNPQWMMRRSMIHLPEKSRKIEGASEPLSEAPAIPAAFRSTSIFFIVAIAGGRTGICRSAKKMSPDCPL